MLYRLDVNAMLAELDGAKRDLESGDSKEAQQTLRHVLEHIVRYNYQMDMEIVYNFAPTGPVLLSEG